jgi:predicted component of type VI protein secretion system
MLFENTDDPLLETVIKNNIEAAISNFEPRAKVLQTDVESLPDSNTLRVRIKFMLVNERFPVDLEVAIERVR